jgi:hypothetical protein
MDDDDKVTVTSDKTVPYCFIKTITGNFNFDCHHHPSLTVSTDSIGKL